MSDSAAPARRASGATNKVPDRADGGAAPQDVIPVNWPPVTFRTWPETKFDHGEQR